MQNSIVSSFKWQLFERISTLGIGFLINIILARILSPQDYAVVAIINVFILVAQNFVDSGFNNALIQNKKATASDYSTVLIITIVISIAIMAGLFYTIPYISSFYQMPDLTLPFRSMLIILLLNSFFSVINAKLIREMQFKTIFVAGFVGVSISGIVGIYLAINGYGVWALIIQQVLMKGLNVLVSYLFCGFHFTFKVDLGRAKEFFDYGWKLLLSGVLNTLYNQLNKLVIGKKFQADMLAYYDKGDLLTEKLMSILSSSISTVMFPIYSKNQDDVHNLKLLAEKTVRLSCFIAFPIMFGLATVSKPLISILLTDKWLPCVPFMVISSINYAFTPIAVINLQVMKALGRSDLFLKLEIIKKIAGILSLTIAVVFFDTPIAIALSVVAILPIGFYVNAAPNTTLIAYSIMEQLKDISPSLLMSVIMVIVVYPISLLAINNFAMITLQIGVGVVVYCGGAMIMKNREFALIINWTKNYLNKESINKF